MASGVRILKNGRARQVLLETSGRAGTLVIKRFRHPARWYAPGDRRRARNEFALLEWLHTQGLAVPRPLDVRRSGEGWEVRMEWIPGARTLAELCAAASPEHLGAEVRWEVLMHGLGRLLGRLAAIGVEHPDLHLENVLVDSGGSPWLIDFHAARPRPRLGCRGAARRSRRLAAHVTRWTALLRESLPARLRWRLLSAWRAALPPALATDFAGLHGDPLELEARGRSLRREQVEHAAGRWLRPSSRVEASRARGVTSLRRLDQAGLPKRGERLVLSGARVEVERRWRNAARLEEHRIACARPLALERGPAGTRATFVWPEGVQPLGESAPSLFPRLAGELGALLGSLHDRGLDLPHLGADELAVDPAGRLLLTPPALLLPCDPLSLAASPPGSTLRDETGPREGPLRALRRAAPPLLDVDDPETAETLLRTHARAFRGQPLEERILAERAAGPIRDER